MGFSRKSKALVLRTTKYAEADLIVQFLTSDGEKISLLARGALRSKKRFGGGLLEPTRYLEIQYRPSKREDGLGALEEAQSILAFDELRQDYDRLSTALFVVEIASVAAQEGDMASRALFDLIGNSLKALCLLSDFSHFKLHFALKLLHQQGVLEVEEWMRIFLQTPISEHQSLEQIQMSGLSVKGDWAVGQLQAYLQARPS